MFNIHVIKSIISLPNVFRKTALIIFIGSLFAALAQAQPNLSAPISLPGDTGLSPAIERQQQPQISKGADGYLVVWTDIRSALAISVGINGPYSGTGLGTMFDVYAARLDANGNLIDRNPIVVRQSSFNQVRPQVGWNGQNWLVVWHDEVGQNSYEVRGARISPSGAVLDANSFAIKTNITQYSAFPAGIVFDGANWVVYWETFSTSLTNRVVETARIAPDGTVLDPQGRVVYNHDNQSLSHPQMASTGSGFLLVFIESSPDTLYGVRLSASLEQIGGVFRISPAASAPRSPRIAANSNGYFVVWDDHMFSSNVGGMQGTRISATGQVLDPNAIDIQENVGIGYTTPQVVWNGANWFVIYDSEYDETTQSFVGLNIYGKRVSAAGAILDQNAIRVSTAANEQMTPAIAAGAGGEVQTVWLDRRGDDDIYGTQVSAGGAVSAERAISLGAPRQSKPRMMFGGGVYLAVFEREITGDSQIYAQRLDARGVPIDQQPFLISQATNRSNFTPSVGWNGTNFLVVWNRTEIDEFGNQPSIVYGKRIAPTGTIVDAAPLRIMNGFTPDVSALGDTFLVACVRRVGSQFRYIEAVRVSGAGAVLGTPVTINSNYSHAPRVEAFGNRWLVVYEYHSRHDRTESWIYADFVDASGTIGTSYRVSVSDNPLNSGISYDDTPDIAVSGSEALIVWADNDTDLNNIKARRIQADGTLLGSEFGFLVSTAASRQLTPNVIWDGSQYIATWVDHRQDDFPAQPRGDVFAARISQTGNVLDPNGFPVANSNVPEDTPAIATANGATIFAYSAFQDAPFSAMRVTVRSTISANKTPFDFDGDGKSDFGIFRSAPGEWWINHSSTGQTFAAQFGASTDKIAPADFTGDGKTDIGVFRPASGEWFVLRSEDNSFFSFPFGANGDIPVSSDYDADGKADAAVFRPSDSNWYIQKSSGGVIIQKFGANGDIPVPADYDGDNKTDIAIYRPSVGQWWIQRSSTGLIAFQFGNNSDKPVAGDFTGDGKADVAFWRPLSGEWFVLRSENQNYYSFPFGANGDVPTVGDYDGDGRTDAAVFRSGVWHLQRTASGYTAVQFGLANDTPIPAAYLP